MNTRAPKSAWRLGLHGAAVECVEQRVHAVQPERRAEKARKDLALTDEAHNILVCDRSLFEIPFEQRLIADCQLLVQRTLVAEVDHARGKPRFQLTQQQNALCAVQIHLVDEQERRDAVPGEQPPERLRVRLHAVCAADDEHRVIEHLKRTLHFCGEIDMSRRVEQRHLRMRQRKLRLLGEDRDAALPLERKGVEKCIPVIDPPHFLSAPAWKSIASESVVFPASTCAVMPIQICFIVVFAFCSELCSSEDSSPGYH